MDDVTEECPSEELLMLIDGELEGPEKARVENHLEKCSECRRFLDFVRGFAALAKESVGELAASAEPCPSSLVLALYTSGELVEETAAHVGAHLLHCEHCFAEFLALEKIEEEHRRAEVAAPQAPPLSSVLELVVRLARGAFEVLKASGEVFKSMGAASVPVPIRAPESETLGDFVRMTQHVGSGLFIELRLFRGSEPEMSRLSVFAHRRSVTHEKSGVRGLEVKLSLAEGEPLVFRTTPRSGIAELGEWAAGEYELRVSEQGKERAILCLGIEPG